jgi:hypothetical protein
VNIGLSHETRKQEKLSKWIIINYTKMVTHHDYKKTKKGPCLKQTGASYIILSWLKKQKKEHCYTHIEMRTHPCVSRFTSH